MNLKTTYLGLELKSPLVASSSPYMQDLDKIKEMEDAGAAAVVLHSLYEEEIQQERHALMHHMEYGTDSYAESLSYFPEPEVFYAKTDTYLEHIRKAHESVDIPVIASLNGASLGGWIMFAKKMEESGASAIELNSYNVPTDPDRSGTQVEHLLLEIVKSVKDIVSIL